MDAKTTVKRRLADAGLEGNDAPNASTTIGVGVSAATWRYTQGTLASAAGEAPFGTFPRISVDLDGTSSKVASPPERTTPADRDLEIIGLVGEGGMGRVFLAKQHSLDRDVAIKTVRDSASADDRALLMSEGAVTGHLEHPGIIPVHAVGLDVSGRPVIVMKHVEGVEWSQLLSDPDHPAWADWGGAPDNRLEEHLEILQHVCNAVHFANSNGIIHRDIKPQNVLIGRFGDVYLADWGIATKAGDPDDKLCGTVGYIAPEMVLGGRVDETTDVYLLGAVLHRVLTGKYRHQAETVFEALESAVESEPFDYPATVPAELGHIANGACSRDRGARPKNAVELRRQLVDFRSHRASLALSDSALERLRALKTMLERADEAEAEDFNHRVDQLVIETRFALGQALEAWDANSDAKKARDELDDLLSHRRARAADLERLVRSLDPNTAARQRRLSLIVVAALGVGLGTAAVLRGNSATPRDLLLESLVPLATVVALGIWFRKQLMQTAPNRHAFALLLTIAASVTGSRLLGFVTDAPVATTLMYDSLLLTAELIVGAAIMLPMLAWAAVVAGTGVVVSAVWPSVAHVSFAVTAAASIFVGLVASGRFVRVRLNEPRQSPPA